MGAKGAVEVLFRGMSKEQQAKVRCVAAVAPVFAVFLFDAQELAGYEERFNNPLYAAKYGFVDDVIMPRDTRARLCQELDLLREKSVPKILRKHGNPPL